MQPSHLPPRRLNGKALEKCLGHDKKIHPHANDSSMGAERTPRQEASTAEESSAVCMFIQPERREGWREWWKANNERWRGRGGRQRWSRELMRRQRKGNTQRWMWWKDGRMVLDQGLINRLGADLSAPRGLIRQYLLTEASSTSGFYLINVD